MTLRTPQFEVFWALLSSSKHSGVPEDSKSPTLEVLGFTPTLGQSGVATESMPMETMKVHLGQKKFIHFIKGKIALSPIEKLFPFLRNWNI
jgi:hypothetical protein